ncbi:MAG TPA: 50S ribosomal protein L1 [Actinomycetota bacterium]|nr:50S ribosomal protein L1 [Actinomycetota bacterium]
MSGRGKRYTQAAATFEEDREYTPGDAIRALKEFPDAKFDETVELAARLGVDPRKADQLVRGTVSLPNGTGKSVRVAAFAQGPKATEAKEAGADVVGGEELVEQVIGGTIDFEAAVATPDMMAAVGKAGRVLGPRGLMPNPKTGTVTNDIGKAVQDIKGGKIEYKTDRSGNVHAIIGKKSFSEQQLFENYLVVIEEILRVRPSAAKGKYVKTLTIATTMGPGIAIDTNRLKGAAEVAATA